jgi:tRNA A37 threonylcarbamoyladenosine synthetase subunit TsaC/SUA5/YrdC
MPHDVTTDARCLVDTLQSGGIALFQVDVGYAIVGNHEAAIERIFAAKQRSYDKPCGMFSNWQMVQDLAILGTREYDMVDTVIHRYDLPLSIVTPYRVDSAFFRGLTPTARLRSSRTGTIDMLLNAGQLHDAVAQESYGRRTPVLGSSANRSLTGSKYSLGDVEQEVRDAADLVLDYGPTKYTHPEGMGSSIIELPSGRALRRGIRFEEICDILARHFDVDPRRPV